MEKPGANMRDLIVKKSIALFLKTSFKATSIQHITAALGITKGAFYWHFKSKDELLLTIIDKYENEFLSKLYAHMEFFEGDFLKKFREYHKYINEYARVERDNRARIPGRRATTADRDRRAPTRASE